MVQLMLIQVVFSTRYMTWLMQLIIKVLVVVWVIAIVLIVMRAGWFSSLCQGRDWDLLFSITRLFNCTWICQISIVSISRTSRFRRSSNSLRKLLKFHLPIKWQYWTSIYCSGNKARFVTMSSNLLIPPRYISRIKHLVGWCLFFSNCMFKVIQSQNLNLKT